MVKRIIFDLDDTLILWNSEWLDTINKTFRDFGLDCNLELKNKFIEAKDSCLQEENYITEEKMRSFISKRIGVELPTLFISKWKEKLSCLVPVRDKKLIDTISYLATRYELVVASNWFSDQQIRKMELFGILPYFKEVIGIENFKTKPDNDMFSYYCRDLSCSEVVMVGNNFVEDIKPAIELGIYSYYLTSSEKKTKDNLYSVIHDIKELKKVL